MRVILKSPKYSLTKYTGILLILVFIGTIIYFNLISRGFGLDLIILFFGALATLRGNPKEFLRDWLKYLILFWAYETTRGIADNIAKMLHREIAVDMLINMDRSLFHVVPTVYLQKLFPPAKVPFTILFILFLFYTLFFWYWASVGYYLWLKNRKIFHRYMITLISLSFISAAFYAFMPSAPPWYAAYLGKLPNLDRFLWSKVFPSNGISFVHFWDQNYFAAFPSLHFSWPLLASLFLIKTLNTKLKYLFLIIPLIIGFAIVYGAEHYVVDCIAGGILTGILFTIANRKR